MWDTIVSFAQNQSSETYSMEFVFQLASIVGMWKMFEKAGEDGWPAIIPFYNAYKLCDLTMGDPWYWVRLFVFAIPVVGWIAGLYFLYQMSRATALAYGKPESWTWGFFFLAPIFYCIVGFGDAAYYGPMGSGDNRSGDAKGATTVKFDVIKNDPEPEVKEYRQNKPAEAQAAEKKEEDIEFIFDQPEE